MIKRMLSLSLILSFMGLLALYYVGSYLTKPHQASVSMPHGELALTDVSFKSESGSLIYGWYIEGSKNKGGVLLMHGVKSNRLQMLRRAKFLHKAGYSILLFDFQGHGESQGENITFGYLESMDAEAAYAFLLDKLNYKSIGVIGVSLGGASALLGSVAKQCKALILESVYPTIEEAILNRLVIRIGSLGKYLLPLLTWQIEPRLGLSTEALKPIEHLSKVTGSVFIIAGEKDKHTTLNESHRIFAEANEPKKIWVVEGAEHVNFDQFQQKKYESKILEFFNETL